MGFLAPCSRKRSFGYSYRARSTSLHSKHCNCPEMNTCYSNRKNSYKQRLTGELLYKSMCTLVLRATQRFLPLLKSLFCCFVLASWIYSIRHRRFLRFLLRKTTPLIWFSVDFVDHEKELNFFSSISIKRSNKFCDLYTQKTTYKWSSNNISICWHHW